MHLLQGLPGSGKTSRLHSLAREALKVGDVLWLSPNLHAASAVRRSLPDATSLRVTALGEFAESALFWQQVRVLSSSESQLLLAKVARRGKATTARLVARTSQLIRQLRHSDINTETHLQAVSEDPSLGDVETARIAAAFDEALRGLGAIDADSVINAASEVITGDSNRVVVVDGFAFLHANEIRLLRTLAGNSREVHLSIPFDPNDPREELFTKQAAFLEALDRHFENLHCEHLPPPADDTAVSHIAGNLFTTARTTRVAESAEGSEVVEATGSDGEPREIARRIRKLIDAGVSPADVVVSVPNDGALADRVAALLSDCGIPAWHEFGIPLSRAPLVRAALSLIELEAEDWPVERLLSVIGSSYFSPRRCEHWHGQRTVAAIRHSLAVAKLIGNRERIIEHLSHENEHEGGGMVSWLSDITEPLRSALSKGKLAETVLRICDALGIRPIPGDGLLEQRLFEREQQAWHQFERVLQTVAEFASNSPMQIQELVSTLWDERTTSECPADTVRVLSFDSAIGTRSRHLFIAGLDEKCGSGMLTFLRLVCSAGQVTLSYTAVSETGERRYPSPLLTAVRDLFTDGALTTTAVGRLDPVPTGDDVLTSADRRTAAARELRNGNPSPLRRMESSEVAQNVLAAATAAEHRFATSGFTRFEGRIDNPIAKRHVGDNYFETRQFSVTELEEFSRCPFRFLAGRTLKLATPEPLDVSANHLERGQRLHYIVAKLVREDHEQMLACDTEAELPEFVQLRFRELAAEFARVSGLETAIANSPVRAALDDVERRLLDDWAIGFANQFTKYHKQFAKKWDAPPTPLATEIRFGNPRAEPGEDESESPPARFANGTVKLCGRIDRIDIGEADGKPTYHVIDYKSGRVQSAPLADVATGRALQLPVYQVAAKRLGLVKEESAPQTPGLWELRWRGFTAALRRDETDPPAEDVPQYLENLLDELLPRVVAEIRDGHFVVHNDDVNCTSRCDFARICRVGQIRPLAEKLGKQRETACPKPHN